MRALAPSGAGRLPIALALALVLCAVWAAPPAGAHEGEHAFESLISGLSPVTAGTGIEVRMLDYDEQIELINRSGKTVIVEGYAGEPYARVESEGPVWLNLRSPSLAPSNDRWGRTPPRGDEDASRPPNWVKVGDHGRLTWFDRRSHYRRPGTPPAVTDAGQRQQLWDYRIPISVGGAPAEILGSLHWTGRRSFPLAAFLALLRRIGELATS